MSKKIKAAICDAQKKAGRRVSDALSKACPRRAIVNMGVGTDHVLKDEKERGVPKELGITLKTCTRSYPNPVAKVAGRGSMIIPII